MKIKILESSGWYRNDVGIIFEQVVYDIHPRLRFYVDGQGWVYESDCVITELPESFCVKRCNDIEKWKKYIQWLDKTYDMQLLGSVSRYYYGVVTEILFCDNEDFGTEIHIDDMIKHIDYMESQQHVEGGEQFSKESQLTVKMEKQKLSRQGLKEIHSVACSKWKGKLQLMGIRNPLENFIELNQDEVNEIFNACTKEQLPIVSKYLKQDDGSVDIMKFKCEIYDNDGRAVIEKRFDGEYGHKSLLLDDAYNWEIKKDSKGYLCLIPTKIK